jgi:hypothetical protein
MCSYSKPEEYGIVEVPLPKLRANDVLIKVKACGVCGTDLHIHEGEFIAKVCSPFIWRDVVGSLHFLIGGLVWCRTWMVTASRLNSPFLHSLYPTEANALFDSSLLFLVCNLILTSFHLDGGCRFRVDCMGEDKWETQHRALGFFELQVSNAISSTFPNQ